jgi:NAD(P)-dependent dehydrogenase (short-subunit alcohol dehydrogenase family)
MYYVYNISTMATEAGRGRARNGLRERVMLVTGAAGGIGRALLRSALDAGMCVAAFDRKDTPLPGTVGAERVLLLHGDATRETDVRHALRSVDSRWGRLDVLVNGAGRVGRGRLEEVSLREWRQVLEANLTSAFLFCKHALPALRRTKGCIVSLSSTNALTGGSALSGPAYAAAKAGLIALTRNLARDLAPDGVRANAIAAGPIDTPMLDRLGEEGRTALKATIPLGELGTPEDVAGLVLFLASPAARFLTGATISLSGGLVMH